MRDLTEPMDDRAAMMVASAVNADAPKVALIDRVPAKFPGGCVIDDKEYQQFMAYKNDLQSGYVMVTEAEYREYKALKEVARLKAMACDADLKKKPRPFASGGLVRSHGRLPDVKHVELSVGTTVERGRHIADSIGVGLQQALQQINESATLAADTIDRNMDELAKRLGQLEQVPAKVNAQARKYRVMTPVGLINIGFEEMQRGSDFNTLLYLARSGHEPSLRLLEERRDRDLLAV